MILDSQNQGWTLYSNYIVHTSAVCITTWFLGTVNWQVTPPTPEMLYRSETTAPLSRRSETFTPMSDRIAFRSGVSFWGQLTTVLLRGSLNWHYSSYQPKCGQKGEQNRTLQRSVKEASSTKLKSYFRKMYIHISMIYYDKSIILYRVILWLSKSIWEWM